jgi:ketol-acid reductoisomerase
MSKIYYDKDGDISFVTDKTIAIIGYGNQGRSQALNMRDSGVKDIVIGSVSK